MHFIDSHCHLDCIDLARFNDDFDEMMARTLEENVQHMLCVSISLNNWHAMHDTVKNYLDRVSLSVGIHPCNVEEEPLPTLDSFAEMLAHPNVIAIGETGLDYYYTEESKLQQQDYFIRQIDIAKKTQKPLIIHTRSAREDTINILKHENARDAGAILHCFTENWEMAKQGLDQGFYVSFSGIITFKNAAELREVVRKMPLDRILIETDSPYLAPVPYRGKINFPGHVPEVAKMIAEIKGLSLEETADLTRNNFNTLFNTQF